MASKFRKQQKKKSNLQDEQVMFQPRMTRTEDHPHITHAFNLQDEQVMIQPRMTRAGDHPHIARAESFLRNRANTGFTDRTQVGKRISNASFTQRNSMENLPNHQHGEDPRDDNQFINGCLRQKNTTENQTDHRLRDNPTVENGFMNGIFEQDEEGSANESEIVVKETRGPTYMQNIWGRSHNLPLLQVEYNEFGQPVGGENSKLCHFLGTVARNGKYCPIDVKNWHLMPRTKKTDILDVVKLRFHVPVIAEKWILTSVGSKWRNWKHCLKTKHWCDNVSIAHLIEERDERVEEDQWIRLLTYWKTEESLKVSERNVDARGKKLMNQRTGKTSFAHIKAKVTKEKGRCPTRVELFNLCFVPSNENPSEVVLSKYSAMQERSNQLSEGSDDAIGPDDIFAQVMGKDVSGHVRMMGQGVCPRDVWSETPRSTSNRLLMEHQAKIAHLQNMLLTQQRPQTSQANIGQYPTTSNSFSPNATSALPLQVGEYVSLKSLFDPQKIVAKGYVYSTDPSKKVGGQSLGLNWCEINVKVIDEPEEQLIRPYDNLQNISQTAGQMVAWPCHLVTPIEDLTI